MRANDEYGVQRALERAMPELTHGLERLKSGVRENASSSRARVLLRRSSTKGKATPLVRRW